MMTRRDKHIAGGILVFALLATIYFSFEKAAYSAPPVSAGVSVCDPSNIGNCQGVNVGGQSYVQLFATSGNALTASTPNADAVASSNIGLNTNGFNYVYNGATWDRLKGANGVADVFPYGGSTLLQAASGVQANAAAVATLAGAVGKFTYIAGYKCSSNGETTATATTLTITGISTQINNPMPGTVVAAGVANTIAENFSPPIASNAANTAIVVTLPAQGAGNTFAECHAWGFQF